MLRSFWIFFFLFYTGMGFSADLATLGKVEILSGGDEVQLVFDRKLNPNQIKTEFVHDIIQLSISDTSVYPAKMLRSAGGKLNKVFTYQYTPRLIRTRLSVEGKAEEYRQGFKVLVNGKVLTLRLGAKKNSLAAKDMIAVSHAKAQTQPPPEEKKTDLTSFQNDLLQKVIAPQAPKTTKSEKLEPIKPKENTMLKLISVLTGLVLILVGVLQILKRISKKSGSLGRVETALQKLIGVKKGRMIEVVANHYLGPKKSIAVVKVQGQMMVLGITNENINLITQLDAAEESQVSELLESPGPSFSSVVEKSQGTGAKAAGKASFSSVIRDRIHNRLEGFKQL